MGLRSGYLPVPDFNSSFLHNSDNSLTDITVPTGTGTQMKSTYGYDTSAENPNPHKRFYPSSLKNTQVRTAQFGYDNRGHPPASNRAD